MRYRVIVSLHDIVAAFEKKEARVRFTLPKTEKTDVYSEISRRVVPEVKQCCCLRVVIDCCYLFIGRGARREDSTARHSTGVTGVVSRVY